MLRAMQICTTGVQWEVFIQGLDTPDYRFLSLVDAACESGDNATVESRDQLSCAACVKIKGVLGGLQ